MPTWCPKEQCAIGSQQTNGFANTPPSRQYRKKRRLPDTPLGHGKIDRQHQPKGMAATLTRQDTKTTKHKTPPPGTGTRASLTTKTTLTKKRKKNTNLVRHAFQTPPRFWCHPRALPRFIDPQARPQFGAPANPKCSERCCSGPCRALCWHEGFSPAGVLQNSQAQRPLIKHAAKIDRNPKILGSEIRDQRSED